MDRLTRRERDYLELAAEGLTSAEIAARLSVTRGTVHDTLSRVYRHIGANQAGNPRSLAVAMLVREQEQEQREGR